VPIREINLLGSLESQCAEPPEKIIFVLEKPLTNPEKHLPYIWNLCDAGFRFGIGYPMPLTQHDPILQCASFLLLSQDEDRADYNNKALNHAKRFYRNLVPVALDVASKELLESLYSKGYGLFESKVYKPAGRGGDVSPLKVNAIRLINTVQDENFEFDEVSKVVRGDPALTVSLLKMVNASANMRGKISSIQQAVAMLGQREVRKWVTTAVSRSLGSDRPNEMTRLSLLRAKFAENLAGMFEMAHMAGELFLTGLFSVLDSILDLPMSEALEQVMVTNNVRAALVEGKGIYAPVIKFVKDYENASWADVSRQMIISGLDEDELSEAYLSALTWYRDLVTVDADTQDSGASIQESGATAQNPKS
jgi:EAL and modified HD-GYP domain-containing signal transduction protein